MKAVERTIYITPSKSPSSIKVFWQDDGERKEISSAQTISKTAGTTIDNLCKLYPHGFLTCFKQDGLRNPHKIF